MPKQMIEILFQFENLSDTLKDASQKIEDAGKEAGEDYARELRGAMGASIAEMSTVKRFWHSIDLSHPIQSAQRALSVLFDSFKNRFPVLSRAIGLAAVGLGLMFRSLLQPQEELIKMFSQLRVNIDGVGTTLEEKVSRGLRDVADVAVTTGSSMNDVARTYRDLAEMRVPVDDLKQLTETTIVATHALGANQDQMRELIGSLRVMGRMSVTEIGQTVEMFSQVQDAIGLTNNEMSQLITTTTELTRYMGAFGAAPKDITNMAEATAKLTGVFGELGLGAERAGQIMSQIFDPSRLSENVLLISQMGMSMQEYMNMLQGGQVDQVKMTEGLIDAAQEIENMRQAGVNAFALQQRAQMMGFANVQEALRLAQEGDETLAQMNKEMEEFQGRTMAEAAAEGMSSLNEVLGRLRNRFQATFAKFLIPIVSRFSEAVKVLEKRFLENEAAIMNLLNSMMDGFIEFVSKVSFEDILNFFKGLWKGAQNLFSAIKSLWPVLLTVAGAFAALKVVGVVGGLFSNLKGVIGSLVPSLKGLKQGAGGVAKTIGNMGGALKAGLGSFLKMAGVSAIMMSIAGAMFILAQALKTFNEVSWESMLKGALVLGALIGAVMLLGKQKATSLAAAATLLALSGAMFIMAQAMKVFNDVNWESLAKAGAAIVGFTAAMVALGAIMASPVGVLILAGLAGLAAMSGVIIIFAIAIKSLGDALESISPEAIEGLAEVASPELVKNLGTVGKAIKAFLKPIGLLQLLKSKSVMEVGIAIKELALGLWVLSETPDFTDIAKDLEIVSKSISEVLKGKFRGNAEEVGEGFRLLTEGIENLTVLETGSLANLGEDMLAMLEGLQGFLAAMKAGATRDFLGLGKNLEELGVGFKELALGIWVLGETQGFLGYFNTISGQLSNSISNLLNAMGEGGRSQLLESGQAFKAFAEGLKEFGAIDEEDLDLDWMLASSHELGEAVKAIINSMDVYVNNLEDVGKGFKELALGIWVLGEAGEKADWFIEKSQKLADGIGKVLGKLGDVNSKKIRAGADAFKILIESLATMPALNNLANSFAPAANGIAMLAKGLEAFTPYIGHGKAANHFIKFLKGLNAAGPIQVEMETPTGGEVEVTGRMNDLEGAGSVEVSLRAAYEEQTSKVVEAINNLKISLTGEDSPLIMIMDNITSWNRKGLKTKPT